MNRTPPITTTINPLRRAAACTFIAVLVLLMAGGAACESGGAEGYASAKVLRVVDGDTIEVSFQGEKEKVRLIGIDTPESVHPDKSRNVPYGKIASQFTEEALLGRTVGLEFDVQERDRYNRLLAYVHVDGVLFNRLLLEEGHASVATYPPNVRYVDDFTAAQQTARESGKGQWGNGALGAGQSVEDGRDNGQDDAAGKGETAEQPGAFIASARSKKFHTQDCASGKRITENNALYFATRDAAVEAGFSPCQNCSP
jgi:micrococcal nuclease